MGVNSPISFNCQEESGFVSLYFENNLVGEGSYWWSAQQRSTSPLGSNGLHVDEQFNMQPIFRA
jgi:hypothetical protein